MKSRYDCIVMGAAGRDFHNYLSFLRGNPHFRVRAFTATQIPFIDQRAFPRALAGPDYDADIPIHDESELTALIDRYDIDFVFFAYSDLPHREVMHRAALVQAAGASFVLLGPRQTTLRANRPVVAITATRTGTGKSPLTQWLARSLTDAGIRVGVLRHPMPYGDLRNQAVQRFAELADLDVAEVGRHVEDRAVLDGGLGADPDRAVVPAQDRPWPDRAARADLDVSDHGRGGVDVGAGVDAGVAVAVGLEGHGTPGREEGVGD